MTDIALQFLIDDENLLTVTLPDGTEHSLQYPESWSDADILDDLSRMVRSLGYVSDITITSAGSA